MLIHDVVHICNPFAYFLGEWYFLSFPNWLWEVSLFDNEVVVVLFSGVFSFFGSECMVIERACTLLAFVALYTDACLGLTCQ